MLATEKRILEMIAKRDSLNEILDNLCRLVEAQAGDVLASILLLDGNRLRHGGSPSLPKAFTDAINGAVIGPSAGSCGTAAYRGQPVIVEDIATDPLWADYRDLALSHSLCACWSTPVFSSQGKVIATFAMYYREPRRPTQRDQEIIDLITHLAGVTIQQQKAFDEIKKSEDRLRLVIDTIPALVWSSRPDGAVEYFNQPYLDYTGLSLDQAAAGWPRAFHPDDMAGMLEKWRALLEAGVRGEAEARLRRFDGAYRWFLFKTEPLRDEVGNIVKWYGLFTDIEDRKRTEEALRESEQRFRDYAETASDWHWETGPNHLITRVSDLYNVGIPPSRYLAWLAGRLQPMWNRSPKNGDCIGRYSTHIGHFAISYIPRPSTTSTGLYLRYTSKQAASHFMTQTAIFSAIGAPAPTLLRRSVQITPNRHCARRRQN